MLFKTKNANFGFTFSSSFFWGHYGMYIGFLHLIIYFGPLESLK